MNRATGGAGARRSSVKCASAVAGSTRPRESSSTGSTTMTRVFAPSSCSFKTVDPCTAHTGTMTTDISARYRKLAEDFADTVAQVPADKWSAPSPCEEWTARDVVRHVVETPSIFAGMVGRTLEPGPERR